MKKLLLITLILWQSLAAQQIILNESFESGNIPTTWINLDIDNDGNLWEKHNATAAHTGQYSVASYSWFNGNVLYPNNWLITPRLQLSDSASLTYWVSPVSQNYNTERYFVRVSSTGTLVTDFATTLVDETLAAEHKNWQQRTVNLKTFAKQDIYIAFVHAQISNQFAIKLDDIQVTNFQLSTDNIANKQDIIFPNPTSDKIHIYTTKNIEKVEIIDIYGHIVMISPQKAIDLQNLQPGIYTIKIKYDDASTELQKIVKK